MSTIGSVILRMEAQHQPLTDGLGQGEKSLNRFGQSIKNVNHEQFANGLHKNSEATKSFGSSLDSLKGLLAGVAVGFALHAVSGFISETIKSTTESYRLSAALGITTGSLQALQTAGRLAGVDSEEFNGALRKMIKNLGEAKDGTGPAAEALSRLHISAQQLEGLHTDEVFKLIAEKISKVKDPLEQARAEVGLFGKEGQKLHGVFAGGAAGIDEAAEKARKFGVSLSEVDSAKLVGANEKFEEISLAVQGVENQLTIALAPVLGEIAEKVLAIIPPADQMRSSFLSGIEAVATGIGYLDDAFRIVKVGILGMGYVGVATLEGMVFVVKKLADAIVWVADKLGMHIETPAFLTDSLKSLDEMRKSMGDQVKEMWNQPSAVSKVHEFFDGVTKKANETATTMAQHKKDIASPIVDGFNDAGKKVEQTLAEMAKQVGQFGLTEGQKKLFDLQAMGANPEQLKLAQQYSDELTRLESKKKEQEEAGALIKKVFEGNPLSKYQSELEKLNKLHNDGLINAQVYAAGVAEANKGLAESFKGLEDAANKKVGAESRRFDFSGPAKSAPLADPLKQIARNGEMQQKDVAQSKFYLQQIYQFGLNANQSADTTVEWN